MSIPRPLREINNYLKPHNNERTRSETESALQGIKRIALACFGFFVASKLAYSTATALTLVGIVSLPSALIACGSIFFYTVIMLLSASWFHLPFVIGVAVAGFLTLELHDIAPVGITEGFY